jgi:2-oxoacid:acceptor oxidoreductase delta subunit (pyruvate/2-ketoisovalerate family)
MKPIVDPKACTGCGVCVGFCPDSCIVRSEVCADGSKPKAKWCVIVDYDYCKGCGICAHECKVKAITMLVEEK